MTMNMAEFSECRKFRYTLWRHNGIGVHNLEKSSYVNFICLNPSKADEFITDNTITKCVKFARSWGYEAMCVTNLFAFRATHVSDMKAHPRPVGPNNDFWIPKIAANASLVVAAWSQHGGFLGRSAEVLTLLPNRPHILRMGKGKHPEPWHPLYLPDSTQPIPWDEL